MKNLCPICNTSNLREAQYCMQCGHHIASSRQDQADVKPRLDILGITLLGSIATTMVLTMVFHLPIFILGAFLPFVWLRPKR